MKTEDALLLSVLFFMLVFIAVSVVVLTNGWALVLLTPPTLLFLALRFTRLGEKINAI